MGAEVKENGRVSDLKEGAPTLNPVCRSESAAATHSSCKKLVVVGGLGDGIPISYTTICYDKLSKVQLVTSFSNNIEDNCNTTTVQI